MRITLGVDPEFGVIDTKTEKHVSAHNLVKGTKAEPFKLRKGAMQADGTMIEFNIEPAKNAKEFVKNIETVLKQIRRKVPKRYVFDFSPTIRFDKFYFDKVPDDPKELGCDPDYAAWYSGQPNPRPVPLSSDNTLRTCAGHIHVGFTQDQSPFDQSHFWDCQQVVKSLDQTVGYILQEIDKDTLRKQLYGAAGAFRPKPYGVEWRTPSNVWLNYPELWPWLFDATVSVVSALEKGDLPIRSYYGLDNSLWSKIYATPRALETSERIRIFNYYFMKTIKNFPPAPVKNIGIVEQKREEEDSYDYDIFVEDTANG